MRIYRKNNQYDACRSFFIYNDGRLFVQFVKKEDSPTCIGSDIYIDMKGGTISGTLVALKGTGIILDNWSIVQAALPAESVKKNLTEL